MRNFTPRSGPHPEAPGGGLMKTVEALRKAEPAKKCSQCKEQPARFGYGKCRKCVRINRRAKRVKRLLAYLKKQGRTVTT